MRACARARASVRFSFVCHRKGAATVQQQNRNMATLKQISMRLKSVTNIQKITQSMKMVSAAKYARAERELRQARPYGDGVKVNPSGTFEKCVRSTSRVESFLVILFHLFLCLQAFFEKSGATELPSTEGENKLIVAITSDRGLCGAVHTNVAKTIRNELSAETSEAAQTKVFCVGDKSRALLQRYHIYIVLLLYDIGQLLGLFVPIIFSPHIIILFHLELKFNFSDIINNTFYGP